MRINDGDYDRDLILGVPAWLRLRTLQALLLAALALSIVAALEWPRAWRLIELADLAAMSVLFGMAACREGLVRRRDRALRMKGKSLPRARQQSFGLAAK